MFRYIDNQDKTFLFGAYRGEKSQLEWILGKQPYRYEKLYNIRFNKDLFSRRRGGVISEHLPDYVLIYHTQSPQDGYHLFPCISSSIKEQNYMEALGYHDPVGSYVVYSLGEELLSEPLDIQKLILMVLPSVNINVSFSPAILKGNDIANMVDNTMANPAAAEVKQENVLRFVDLFAGIGGIRCGLEQAAKEKGLLPVCVMMSEIKPYAVSVLKENHPTETITGASTIGLYYDNLHNQAHGEDL